MVNKELFLKIADAIEAKPESHKQSVCGAARLECGTAYCIGGYALALSGQNPFWGPLWAFADLTEEKREGSAQHLLGLSRREADLLFDGFWHPAEGLTVPQALRLIAEGATVAEVSG